MALLSLLPTPKSTFLPSDEPLPTVDYPIISTKKQPPPYGQRQGWVPRSVEDFGDGGAFPEIHVAQYPLEMGRKNKAPSNQIVPLTMDSQGNVKYDAILGHKVGTVVHSRPQDLQEKHLREEELARPDDEVVNETTLRTKQALEALVQGKIAAAQPTKVPQQSGEPTYIKYTPAQQGGAFNSGSKQRIIRLVEQPKDPLEPPKFRHKRVPGGPPSPPVPVMHSPPRKVTPKDQQDWKIPPCISNWKNAKGYTIPLDKRLAADGRGLQEVQINDNFAKLSESLYLAERNAREEVNSRAQIQKKLMQQEREKKEEMLRNLAQNAREGRVAIQSQDPEEQDEENLTKEELQAKRERDALREERRRDRERERRLEASGKKKSKLSRDEERDISEKVALGEHAPAASKETMYDQRLFNQVQGMESGFAEEDSYNVYDKPLFRGSSANALYRPPKGDDETYGGTSVESIMKTSRFKPDRDFDGAAENRKHSTEPRNKPVEFEREVEEDPFGLDEFLEEAKTAGRKPLDKIGKSGHMHASAGSSVRETEGSSHSRKKIDFDSGNSGKKSKYN